MPRFKYAALNKFSTTTEMFNEIFQNLSTGHSMKSDFIHSMINHTD